MPFISTYSEALTILNDILTQKCIKKCKSIWLRNIRYAIRNPKNPLNLSDDEKLILLNKILEISTNRTIAQKNNQSKTILSTVSVFKVDKTLSAPKTTKKYTMRNSPSYPANENCGKTIKGNDGSMYLSKSIKRKSDKTYICRWQKTQ